jgi:uncharacterized membrane protein (UPF0182 family)
MARRPPPRNPFEPFGVGGPGMPPVGAIRVPHPPRPPRRFWIGLAFIAAAVVIIALAAPLIGLTTEAQWFSALGFGGAYWTRIGLQAALFFVSLAVAFLVAMGNAYIALRRRPGAALRRVGIKRPIIRTGTGVLALATCAVFALVMGLIMRGDWEKLILFRQGGDTGITDPVFHNDVSFYLLQLPFLQSLQAWSVALIVVTAIIVVVLYAWRDDHFDFQPTPRAVAHISVLVAALALVVAFGTWLDRFAYLYGKTGVVSGAGYTDIHAGIPLTTARAVLAVLIAAALVANVRFGRMRVVVLAIGVWVVAAIIGGLYPALVQRVTVQPAELAQEKPYIQREITYTRHAYGLDHVGTRQFGGDQQITAADVATDQATIDNLRLWDYQPLQDTYQQLQSIRTYYTFNDIDLDRYTIQGNYQQVEISAREMDQSTLQAQGKSWVNQRLQYTHGYGVAASPVSKVVGEGLPQFVAQDVPVTGPLKVTRPQIYFGEKESDYVLAPSKAQEFDYPSGNQNVRTQWTGTDAPEMSGANRMLWSLKTGDFNLLVSSEIQDNTRILYRRGLQDRVQSLAPFLQLDDDPYIVAVNGRLYWMQDALVSGSTYPYSDNEGGDFNYVRNSVKVVMDAYTGHMSFYVSAPNDPIIKAYASAFPGMFKPLSAMPKGLQQHIRIPQSLFNIQSTVYATYHIGDPETLYNREDIWSKPLDPYYVMMRLPGQTKAEYLMILPYTPLNKNNLVGWLAVRQDPPHYGQMVSFVLPKDKVVFGPKQVASRIDQTTEISRDYSLLNQSGTNVVRGNLLVVPIGDSFLYFEPWYLKATGQQSLPELKKVILVDATNEGTVAYQNNLSDSINQLVGEAVAPPSGPSPPSGPAPPSPVASQLAQLAQQANQHYQNAQAALKNGDFATYGSETNQVGQLLAQMNQLQGQLPAPAPSPSAAPRASPAPSPSPSRSAPSR